MSADMIIPEGAENFYVMEWPQGEIQIWDLCSGSRLELVHKSLCVKWWPPLKE